MDIVNWNFWLLFVCLCTSWLTYSQRCIIGNRSSVLMEHNGVFVTAGVCGAQWVTTNKVMAMEQAFLYCSWNGWIYEQTCLDLLWSNWDILLLDVRKWHHIVWTYTLVNNSVYSISSIFQHLAVTHKYTHEQMTPSYLSLFFCHSHTPLVLMCARAHWLLGVFCNYSSERGAVLCMADGPAPCCIR